MKDYELSILCKGDDCKLKDKCFRFNEQGKQRPVYKKSIEGNVSCRRFWRKETGKTA